MNTSDDIILVDSDHEFHESRPAQKRSSRATRQAVRQRKPQAKQNKKPSRRGKRSAVILDEDDSLVISEDSVCSNVVDNTKKGIAADNNFGASNSPQDTDINTVTENSVTVDVQPRRTAKRGLAKQKQELPASENTLPHRAAVYSQAVAGFKSFLYGPDPAIAGPDSEVSGLSLTNALAETMSELPGHAVSSDRAESERVLSSSYTMEEAADTSLITSLHIPSPSPPPLSLEKRSRRMNKKLTQALKTLNKAKISLNKITPPRRKARRRDSDIIFVEQEDSPQKAIVVKVRYLTKVFRIKMELNEPFHVLTSKLSREIDEAEHSLGLFLNDRSLEATESPSSVNLTVADIIECHRIKISEQPLSGADAIELVIQCKNNRSRTTITANRRRPLSDVIQKYAQLVNAEVGSFVFSFDGDDIEPTDTPSKLDMEDQDVIDVVYD